MKTLKSKISAALGRKGKSKKILQVITPPVGDAFSSVHGDFVL